MLFGLYLPPERIPTVRAFDMQLLMCCSIENNSTLRKAAVLAALVLVIFTESSSCCHSCESRIIRERGDEPTIRKLPSKKDIFMSRGWGAGGGTAFASRTKPDLYKKNRMLVEMMMGDDAPYERPQEPRVEFLRSLEVSKPVESGRRLPAYVPQLFISSGWGPLGK